MGVGSMRQKIQLQSKTVASDGGGSEAITAWTTFATVYGTITTKSGSQRFFGDQNESPVNHVIKIRFRRNLSHANRLMYKFVNLGEEVTRIFNIQSVINVDNKDKYLEITCIEGVAT
jgi:SPP1 family predicted phage head-tail adaptor